MIEAGAAGVHFEDQLSSAKKCGHMGGKVLVPTSEFEQKLIAARLAADVLGVPTVLIARTDANSAKLITSDVDPRDREFIGEERTPEGFFRFRGGIEAAIARGLAFAPYADLLWCETSKPDIEEARQFAEAIHAEFPGKLLAYNCSPSFNWKQKLDSATIASFQRQLGAMGYKFQFVTLAGFHALNLSMFELARAYQESGMTAYSRLQEREFENERLAGYRAVKHQSFVGTGYFDQVAQAITSGAASTAALAGSTEEEQFAATEGELDRGGRTPWRTFVWRGRDRPRRSACSRRRRWSSWPRSSAGSEPGARTCFDGGPGASRTSPEASSRDSWNPRARSARPPGRWRRPRRTSRTGGSRSPARSSAR